MSLSLVHESVSQWLTWAQDELHDSNRFWLYLAVGAGVLLVVYNASRPKRQRKLPPSPKMAMKTNLIDTVAMEKLVKTHGPIMNFRFMSINMLFLCDVDSIKDALVGQGDAFTGRMQSPFGSYINKDCGLVFIDGPKWQEHRRFVLTVLRSFGFGKNITERIVQEEMTALCGQLAKLNGTTFSPQLPLVRSVANVICLLVFNERCGDDQQFEMLFRAVNDSLNSPAFSSFFALLFYRLVLLLPGDYYGMKNALACLKELQNFMDKKIAEHRATIDYDNERDLIDAYLVEMRKREQANPGKHTFTDFQLFRVIFEIFVAGMETTSTTLTWAMMLMAKYPQVQAKVQAEVDNVIGDKAPQITDRPKLIYATAVLHEIERYASVTPFSVLRRTMEDTEVRGYFIPKNTIVTPYIFGAHRDESVWKNPKEFDPSHFYDESTNSLVNLNHLIPFGAGKRVCLGESLATQELFVLFVGVLQRFRFEEDPSCPLPPVTEDTLLGIIRKCPQYKVNVTQRSKAD